MKTELLLEKDQLYASLEDLRVLILNSECFNVVNPEAYLQAAYSNRQHSYGISNELRVLEGQINTINVDTGGLFNRFLITHLLCEFDLSSGFLRLPDSIIALYKTDLQRICKQLNEMPKEYFSLENDLFVKDIAILTYRLIPVGAEYACPDSGVSRSLLWKKGLLQFFKGLWICLVRSGGFTPFLELHSHVLALEDFNPSGWVKTYLRVAELLQMNPRIRGVIGSSWFLDPALINISPHLGYLSEIPKQGGAMFLFAGYDINGSSGALVKSKMRKKAFEEGRYIPAVYTRIWPRSLLIKWSNKASGRGVK